MTASITATQDPRLQRLMGFLESDPNNLALLGDVAGAAYEASDCPLSLQLLDRYAAIEPLSAGLVNLRGLIAIVQRDFQKAAATFADLRENGHDDPVLRFNLAWSLAMTDDHQAALEMLDDEAIATTERGPSLKIQMMHHLDRYEEGLACGAELAARYPGNSQLMGTLATLALDAERSDLAQSYAEAAGDNAEGLAVLGILQLMQPNGGQSTDYLDRALALRPENPRAWVGSGLALLAAGNPAKGAAAIDRGAQLFGNHLGSWIAAGWAYFSNDEPEKARERFKRALALDSTFAESHGALAVIEIGAGHIDEARRYTEVALRLDRNCLSAALAKSLLLEHDGDPQKAARIREIALSQPVGPNGETIMQAMANSMSGVRRR